MNVPDVLDKTLIAAYTLAHPSVLCRCDKKKYWKRAQSKSMKSFYTTYLLCIEVTRGEVQWHMINICFLQITNPKERNGRSKKRKFDENDVAKLKT